MSAVAAPASFWRRYAAYSLDLAVLGPLAMAFSWPRLVAGWQQTHTAGAALVADIGQLLADTLMKGTPPQQLYETLLNDPAIIATADALQSGLMHLLSTWLLAYLLLAALWHIGGECSPWQGSPGKHALQLRVVDRDNMRLRPLRAGARFVACALSWLSLNLGHLLAAVPPQKRALHDYLAGTRVLCDDPMPAMPLWARAWLGLQIVALVATIGWVLMRYTLALQANLGFI